MNRDRFATLDKESQQTMLEIFGSEDAYARSLPERLWIKSGNFKYYNGKCEPLWTQELQ
tara:strand:- start:1664 stop:1840 length:177 start_codon:yes stop_codon:yes gene_type:complete